jgi:hypothetical protein
VETLTNWSYWGHGDTVTNWSYWGHGDTVANYPASIIKLAPAETQKKYQQTKDGRSIGKCETKLPEDALTSTNVSVN